MAIGRLRFGHNFGQLPLVRIKLLRLDLPSPHGLIIVYDLISNLLVFERLFIIRVTFCLESTINLRYTESSKEMNFDRKYSLKRIGQKIRSSRRGTCCLILLWIQIQFIINDQTYQYNKSIKINNSCQKFIKILFLIN